jgi:hypothetical protein
MKIYIPRTGCIFYKLTGYVLLPAQHEFATIRSKAAVVDPHIVQLRIGCISLVGVRSFR